MAKVLPQQENGTTTLTENQSPYKKGKVGSLGHLSISHEADGAAASTSCKSS